MGTRDLLSRLAGGAGGDADAVAAVTTSTPAASGATGEGEAAASGDDVEALQDELDAELAAMYKQLQVSRPYGGLGGCAAGGLRLCHCQAERGLGHGFSCPHPLCCCAPGYVASLQAIKTESAMVSARKAQLELELMQLIREGADDLTEQLQGMAVEEGEGEGEGTAAGAGIVEGAVTAAQQSVAEAAST